MMGIEELREEIDRSANSEQVAMPNLSKHPGHDPVVAIRGAMRREVVYQSLLACLFLSIYWIPIWEHELQRSLYFICMFITVTMTMGYIFKLSKFLLKTTDFTVSTQRLLDDFVHQAKVTIAGYESFVLAGSFLLPLSMFALFAELKVFGLISSEIFDKWIHLRMNNLEFAGLIVGYLLIVAFVYVITKRWTYLLYGKRIRQLEELTHQLNDQPVPANE